MTLEKQIELLKEWHERAEMYLPIMSSEDIDRFLRWLEDYKQLKEDYDDLDNMLRTTNTENDELKRLLMLAMDSMQIMSRADGCVACSQCRYETPIGEDENGDFINSPHCCKSDCFEWEHHDEAMKLLGGADNAEN